MSRVELADADAMLTDRGFKVVGTLEPVARVALGGSASTVVGNIGSAR